MFVRHLSVISFERGSGVSPCKCRHAFWIDLIPRPICALMQINLSIHGGMPLQRSFLALLDRVCPTRVTGGKAHAEHKASGLPLIATDARTSSIGGFGPVHEVAALQPAARGQEPRGR
jgi:hypothetical protein